MSRTSVFYSDAPEPSGLTYSSGQISDAVDVLHLRPDPQLLAYFVYRHVGINSQLALWGEGNQGWPQEMITSVLKMHQVKEDKVMFIPDMLPWQVPRACRMSWSSLTAAAASSPQLMSGSITSSIRPTPEAVADSWALHPQGRDIIHCTALISPESF